MPENIERPDDQNRSVITNRISVYNEETSPVYDYYAKQNKSQKVDGIGSIEDIFARLSAVIDALK